MSTGKTLFAQLMDFLPWSTFTRLVDQRDGGRYVSSLTCAEHFRVMVFAQLTYCESLDDIEVCHLAQSAMLYYMGFRQETKRATFADANETRSWRSNEEFARHLIVPARKLYINDRFGIELASVTYALDSTIHRSVFVARSLGAGSHDEVGGKDAHVALPARQHPRLDLHFRRQAGGCEYP